MKKPTALKIVIGIAWIQIFAIAAMFTGIVSCAAIPAKSGFWFGYQNSLARSLSSADGLDSFGPEQQGEATGTIIISLIFPVGALLCIRKEKGKGLILFLALGVLVAFGQQSFPLLTIVALIAACQKSVKDYFKAITEKEAEPNR